MFAGHGKRITPAPAGNTVTAEELNRFAEDHPRTCGEHNILDLVQLELAGSPPHLRGTRIFDFIAAQSLRITPAPAGNTGSSAYSSKVERDHPRTCGEHRELGVFVEG